MLFKNNHSRAWGFILAAFGVFALIANLLPDSGMWSFWPVFVIATGVCKFFGCCCHGHDEPCGKR